jgi:hypothetical protein
MFLRQSKTGQLNVETARVTPNEDSFEQQLKPNFPVRE